MTKLTLGTWPRTLGRQVGIAALFLTTGGLATGQSPYRVASAEDIPEAGHRFAKLSEGERGALRRGFRLPLEALFTADSPTDLVAAAVLDPLPDPTRPFLPNPGEGDGVGDPFGDAGPAIASGDLGALGRLFKQEGVLTGDAAKPAASSGGGLLADDDPFAAPAETAAAPAAEEPEDDPFAAGDDDFDEDPFGF